MSFTNPLHTVMHSRHYSVDKLRIHEGSLFFQYDTVQISGDSVVKINRIMKSCSTDLAPCMHACMCNMLIYRLLMKTYAA